MIEDDQANNYLEMKLGMLTYLANFPDLLSTLETVQDEVYDEYFEQIPSEGLFLKVINTSNEFNYSCTEYEESATDFIQSGDLINGTNVTALTDGGGRRILLSEHDWDFNETQLGTWKFEDSQ